VELVTDYLEGALAAPDRERFEAHVARCRDCTAYLDQMRRTLRTLGTLSEDAVPMDAREALLRAFQRWTR
jgi:anti-sigma factor RsiW